MSHNDKKSQVSTSSKPPIDKINESSSNSRVYRYDRENFKNIADGDTLCEELKMARIRDTPKDAA